MRFLPDMIYIDLKKEETRDQEMVQNILRKYHKALKFLFLKYANTGFNTKEVHTTMKTFDEVKDKSGTVSIAEIWKFIKDFDMERITN